METHAHISRAQARDVPYFFLREPFHIPQHKNDAVLRGQLLNDRPQAAGLLAADRQRFRIDRTLFGQLRQFATIGHEFVERKILFGGEFALSATHQAAIFGDFIEPDEKCPRAFKFRKVGKSFYENFLHGVFGIFPLPANFHAERIDGALEQP